MLYRKNLYAWEQMARIGAGVALAAYGAFGGLSVFVAIAAVGSGIALAVTGVFGWCPACAMVGRRIPNKD